MRKLAFFVFLLLGYTAAFAQQAQPVEMADAMRSSGKIYVVIVTIIIIFVGLAIYLFAIDRRLKKIEKNK
jgi:CcmD family protein